MQINEYCNFSELLQDGAYKWQLTQLSFLLEQMIYGPKGSGYYVRPQEALEIGKA